MGGEAQRWGVHVPAAAPSCSSRCPDDDAWARFELSEEAAAPRVSARCISHAARVHGEGGQGTGCRRGVVTVLRGGGGRGARIAFPGAGSGPHRPRRRRAPAPLAIIELPWDARDASIAVKGFVAGSIAATLFQNAVAVGTLVRRGMDELVSGLQGLQPGVARHVDMVLAPLRALATRLVHPSQDMIRHTVAGTLARTMAQIAIHPIDTVKTRLQVKTPVEKLIRWKSKIMTKSFTVALGGRQFLDVKNVLYRGPRDIYLGVIGSMVSTLGVGVLYFGTYQAFKATADEHLASTRFASLSHVMAASTGAVVSALVRVPGDTLKHRVQAYFHPNCWAALQAIVREEGVAGLYKGFSATLIRDVPEIAIQFTAYEAFRRAVVRRRGEEKLPTYEHLLLGGAAGALAASCTMPLDYIKTVVQCGRPEPIFQVLQNTLAAEGPRGLFKGMGPRVLMTTTMSAAFFGLFEFWKQVLKSTEFRKGSDKAFLPKVMGKKRDKIWKRQGLTS